jgi:predicted transcriptional regulator
MVFKRYTKDKKFLNGFPEISNSNLYFIINYDFYKTISQNSKLLGYTPCALCKKIQRFIKYGLITKTGTTFKRTYKGLLLHDACDEFVIALKILDDINKTKKLF